MQAWRNPPNSPPDSNETAFEKVGTVQANPWGLYQVHGNVWDWCEDVWHDNYNGAPTDGSAWLQGGGEHRRVVRGVSWVNGPSGLRAANRVWVNTAGRNHDLGFRLARKLSS
jgi:formylglycine-generating enzyme required for sulfatase activity